MVAVCVKHTMFAKKKRFPSFVGRFGRPPNLCRTDWVLFCDQIKAAIRRRQIFSKAYNACVLQLVSSAREVQEKVLLTNFAWFSRFLKPK